MFKSKLLTLTALFILIFSGFGIYSAARDYAQKQITQNTQILRPVHIFENPAEAAAAKKIEQQKKIQNFKQKITLHGISKKLLLVLAFVLCFPLIVSFLIIKKFNSLVKETNKNCTTEVQNTLDQLNNFQSQLNINFNPEEIETDPQKLADEIDNFLSEIEQDKLDKVEIIQTPQEQNKKSKFTQDEQRSIPAPELKEPKLISQKPISKTKGFYLVDCGKEKALIGYINNEIFILNKFNKILTPQIYVRLTEKIGNKNIFMVKNGSYKALVQVEKERMKVLLEM